MVPALAREHARGLHPRIRRGAALGFQYRWWGILSIALQRSVAEAVLYETGQDLGTAALEPVPPLADLPVMQWVGFCNAWAAHAVTSCGDDRGDEVEAKLERVLADVCSYKKK